MGGKEASVLGLTNSTLMQHAPFQAMGSGSLGTLTSLSLRVFPFQMDMFSSSQLSNIVARLVTMW